MPEARCIPNKQLSMTISASNVRGLPVVLPAAGCGLRGYRPGDEKRWVSLINTGEFGSDWDTGRFGEYMAQPERTEGSRIAVCKGEIVAATFASVQSGTRGAGRPDFVVTHPDHRGMGLGRAVCTEVLRYLVSRGYEKVVLFTDDWRLPAIALYFALGFEPEITRRDMPGRWDDVRQGLKPRC